MLSLYGKNEWLTLAAITLLLAITVILMGTWYLSFPVILIGTGLVLFFRDPERAVPPQRGIVVSPADGRISSIHRIDRFEPFDGPAVCIRIFMSIFNVHINRSPCHGTVETIRHQQGRHLNLLNPSSMEENESNLIVLVHPIRRHHVAAIRQIAGMLARTIVCSVRKKQTLQRGTRLGMIKLGSSTELYLPESLHAEIKVETGDRVMGGVSVLAVIPHQESQSNLPQSNT